MCTITLDSGSAALLGAIIGSATTLLTTILAYHLQNRDRRKLARLRKDRLTKLLQSKKFTWRSMDVLCSTIGANREITSALLIEVGARCSLNNNHEKWALLSRVPFPEDVS